MCAMSVISEWGRTAVPVQNWTPSAFGEFQEILRRITVLDAKLGQPNCEDPAKAEWMHEVEEQLKALEGKP